MGQGSSRNGRRPVTAAPKDRGKTEDIEEVKDWLRKNQFTELPKGGKEAFFRHLCGDVYPEDKDICDVDPKAVGMNTKSRQYQFWLQCEQLERFSELFEAYVTDEDMRLPEVKECFNDSRSSGEKDIEHFLSEKKTDAKNTESFIGDLKSKMRLRLDTCFDQFKKDLEEKFGKKT